MVISISYRCNSKCRTCDVWRKPNDDLTLEEWDKVFQKLGRSPVYMTFTGGEPFLRDDLDQMVISQAYIMSTVDYFTLLGWMFMGLILIVWLAKPPFTAKAGPAASAGH